MPSLPEHPPDGSAAVADWSQLKALWFELSELPADAQHQRLAASDVPSATRARLERMLEAARHIGDRFDVPAHSSLGFSSDTGESEPTASLVGVRLGHFRVTRLAGRGGMGAVYEAERDDDQFQQRVAIKTLWRGADSELLLQRFRSERKILAGLQHPHIAQLIDGGATETGTPWLAMEYVDGVAIDQYCDDHRLTVPARLDLFRAVCDAVHHAHQRLVVHRDLKPSNVLVDASGTVKLLDFGVAKLLDDSGAVGTLTGEGLSPFTAAYAAPEQARGELVSTATDVYSLGALLCTLLAGAPPIDVSGLDAVSRLVASRDGVPRAPSEIAKHASVDAAAARAFMSARRLSAALEGELDAIVGVALRREPQRRYASAQALSDDILRFLKRDRVLAQRDSAHYRAWAFTRRHRPLVFGTIAGSLAVLGAGLFSLWQAQQVRNEAARAERASTFMAGILSGTATASSDAVMRVGPAGTVRQLLDSAVLRVPREFPHDDRIRARLYTAFGANYAAQGRYGKGRAILDSARVLADRGYGRTSGEYARASIEFAALELNFHGPAAATEPIAAALQSDDAKDGQSAISTRLMLLRAQQAHQQGHIRVSDSLAALVAQTERRLRGLTSVVVAAEALRMANASWITRDPRDYLRRARVVATMTDSLGMQYSGERDRAEDAALESMLVLGRADSAEARMRRHLATMRGLYGQQASVEVWSLRATALLASLRGDTATRRASLERARHVTDSTTDISVGARVALSNAYMSDALARKDFPNALSMATTTRDALLPTASPFYLSFAYLNTGSAYLAQGNATAAEVEFRAGLALVEQAPDLSSMGPRLRRPLADALATQGKTASADSVRRLDPPKGTMPPCTPGGNWIGCPDKP